MLGHIETMFLHAASISPSILEPCLAPRCSRPRGTSRHGTRDGVPPKQTAKLLIPQGGRQAQTPFEPTISTVWTQIGHKKGRKNANAPQLKAQNST